MNRLLLFLFCICLPALLVAQKREERRYNKDAENIQKEIWGSQDPAFEITAVPDSLKNESAVIIAKSISLLKDRHTHFVMIGGISSGHLNTQDISMHERVKIQDKAAIEDYAEFSYQKILKKKVGPMSWNHGRTFIGAKIIKPDGKVTEIDLGDAVDLKDEKGDKEKKMAIPGLQVGDILDFYVMVEEQNDDQQYNWDPFILTMSSSYPILHFFFSAKINPFFGVVYCGRQIDMKDFKHHKEDKYNIFSYKENYLSKYSDDQWTYAARELPTLELGFLTGTRRNDFNLPDKGEAKWGLDEKAALAKVNKDNVAINLGLPPSMLKDFKKYYKAYRKHSAKKSLSKKEFVKLAFNYARFELLYKDRNVSNIAVGPERNFFSLDPAVLNLFVKALLQQESIDYHDLMAVPRSEGSLTDIVSTDQLSSGLVVYISEKPMYLFLKSMFSLPGELPSYLEGQKAYEVADNSHVKKVQLPVSSASANNLSQHLNINIDGQDPQKLNIQRTITAAGQCRYSYQLRLLLYQDIEKAERKRLKFTSTFAEDLRDNNREKRNSIVEEYALAFRKARKERDKSVKSDIETDYDLKDIDLKSYKILEQGLNNEAPEFKMQEAYDLDGLVKKAGNNYILDAGKLIGGQIELTPDERNRKYDIYMPYARSFEYAITFNLPAGYEAKGIENLNKNIANESGGFISSSKMEGNKLLISVKKYYNHNYEPVNNWKDMQAFLDAAADFSKQKILLKKS